MLSIEKDVIVEGAKMLARKFIQALVGASLVVAGSTSIGQSAAPATVGAMITVCAPIIDEQYNKDLDRWGQCVAAAKGYLEAVIPTLKTPEEIEAAVALAVEELVKLYRPQDCIVAQTELPIAIETAKSFTTNEVQLAAIDNITLAISGCQQIATAAIQNIESLDAV